VMNPRRDSTRQMVATAGTVVVSGSRRRCSAMVTAPAS
jgi:hypothetical protein